MNNGQSTRTRDGLPRLSEAQGQVARLVRDAGTMSRLEISLSTGLCRPAVTTALTTLLECGLVKEIGSGVSTGGRPPMLVQFDPLGGFVIGVEVGATVVDVAVTDLKAQIVAHAARSTDVEVGPDLVLTLICNLVDELLSDNGIEPGQVRGLAMGLPLPVRFSQVSQVSPTLLRGWNQFPVLEFLEHRLRWPIFIDNDVNLMALGEATAGARPPDFLYVKLGRGIGCGIFSQGRLYRGHNGSAGDIGHIANGFSSALCVCGSTGCLEAVAGGHALARAAKELAASGRSPALAAIAESNVEITAAELGAALRNGDLAALELVRRAGSAVGEVLAGLVNFFNPALIILGGGVVDVGDSLIASIREVIYRRSRPSATRDLAVVTGALGSRAGVVGAASLVLDELYHLSPVSCGAAGSG